MLNITLECNGASHSCTQNDLNEALYRHLRIDEGNCMNAMITWLSTYYIWYTQACSSIDCNRTYELCETTRGFCMNITNTSTITTTSDPPGRECQTSATTQCPITTYPTCPTCPSHTEGVSNQEKSSDANRETTVTGKLKSHALWQQAPWHK